MSSYFPFGFKGRIWDLIVSVPDHCLSFYFIVVAYDTVILTLSRDYKQENSVLDLESNKIANLQVH